MRGRWVVLVVELRRDARAKAAGGAGCVWGADLVSEDAGGACVIVIVIVIVLDVRFTTFGIVARGRIAIFFGCSFCDIRSAILGLRYVVWRNYVTSVAWPTDGFTDPWLPRWSW